MNVRNLWTDIIYKQQQKVTNGTYEEREFMNRQNLKIYIIYEQTEFMNWGNDWRDRVYEEMEIINRQDLWTNVIYERQN